MVFQPLDEELIGKAAHAGYSYIRRGGRLFGRDIAPSVRHVGHKMAKVSKYMQFANAGYKLGKKFVNSFSQKEKTNKMPPVNRKSRSRTPVNRKKSPINLVTPRKSRSVSVRSIRMRSASRVSSRGRNPKGGFSTSHSAGKFAAPTGGASKLDDYQTKGVVVVRENGSTFSGSALLKYQSVGLLHATHGSDQIVADVSLALAKAIATRALGLNVETVDAVMCANSWRPLLIQVFYKTNPTSSVANHDITFDGSAGKVTVNDFADLFRTWWKAEIDAHSNLTFTKIRVLRATQGTTTFEVIGEYDMKRSRIAMYVKSSLKIQNRSINSAGNDEADDVDNVPLYGKVYQGIGNYYLVNDSYYNPLITIQSNILVDGYTKSSPLCEPPPLSQMKRCKTIGKAHLDPGQIKTSVLTDEREIGFNSLNFTIGKSFQNINTLPVGKFRVYLLEKMIQAIATSDDACIRLAYELDLKVGCMVTLPKFTPTTQVVTLSPE